MKTGKSVAVVLGIVLLCFVFGSSALAADMSGTWTGSGKAAGSEGYASFTLNMKVAGQSGSLFKGTITIKRGTKTSQFALSGCVWGAQVYMTIYNASTEKAAVFADCKLAAGSAKMTGVLRDLYSVAGYFTITKK